MYQLLLQLLVSKCRVTIMRYVNNLKNGLGRDLILTEIFKTGIHFAKIYCKICNNCRTATFAQSDTFKGIY